MMPSSIIVDPSLLNQSRSNQVPPSLEENPRRPSLSHNNIDNIHSDQNLSMPNLRSNFPLLSSVLNQHSAVNDFKWIGIFHAAEQSNHSLPSSAFQSLGLITQAVLGLI